MVNKSFLFLFVFTTIFDRKVRKSQVPWSMTTGTRTRKFFFRYRRFHVFKLQYCYWVFKHTLIVPLQSVSENSKFLKSVRVVLSVATILKISNYILCWFLLFPKLNNFLCQHSRWLYILTRCPWSHWLCWHSVHIVVDYADTVTCSVVNNYANTRKPKNF